MGTTETTTTAMAKVERWTRTKERDGRGAARLECPRRMSRSRRRRIVFRPYRAGCLTESTNRSSVSDSGAGQARPQSHTNEPLLPAKAHKRRRRRQWRFWVPAGQTLAISQPNKLIWSAALSGAAVRDDRAEKAAVSAAVARACVLVLHLTRRRLAWPRVTRTVTVVPWRLQPPDSCKTRSWRSR
jgi:hypothetical protein